MGSIEYTTTKFVEPNKITPVEYEKLKQAIDIKHDYEITPTESFTKHFEGAFKFIILTFLGGLILMSIGASLFDGSNLLTIFALPSIILLVTSFIGLIRFFAEAPSFAKYNVQKKRYFNRMRTAIRESENYYEFLQKFYK